MTDEGCLDDWLEDQHRIRSGFSRKEYWGENHLDVPYPSLEEQNEIEAEFYRYDEEGVEDET